VTRWRQTTETDPALSVESAWQQEDDQVA